MSEAGTAPLEDEFGDVIGKARRGLGLEPGEAARRAGLDEAVVRSMEDCERQPTRAESDGLAAALELDAPSLWDVAADAWRPRPQPAALAGGLQVRMIPHPPMRVTMYIVGDPATGQALVVDPGALPDTVLETVRNAGWRVAAYLITHGDPDHIDALAAVYAQTPAPVWVHEGARPFVEGVGTEHLHVLTGDGPFTVGPFALEALETPGHAPGHTAYALRDGVLVGDTVFAGSIGGTRTGDLEYAGQLAAIRSKLLTRGDDTKFFPGHGPPTTAGEEKRHNPFLAAGPGV